MTLAAVTVTAALGAATQAAAIANFTDGAGATPDGYTGSAGNGWSARGAWPAAVRRRRPAPSPLPHL
ncbi:MAG: hypothetical protein QM754_21155 [Tepidisphaeraceae bacterium]